MRGLFKNKIIKAGGDPFSLSHTTTLNASTSTWSQISTNQPEESTPPEVFSKGILFPGKKLKPEKENLCRNLSR